MQLLEFASSSPHIMVADPPLITNGAPVTSKTAPSQTRKRDSINGSGGAVATASERVGQSTKQPSEGGKLAGPGRSHAVASNREHSGPTRTPAQSLSPDGLPKFPVCDRVAPCSSPIWAVPLLPTKQDAVTTSSPPCKTVADPN